MVDTKTLPADCQEWIAALYESEVDFVFGYLISRCGNNTIAEDLTAETFISAARAYANGRGAEVQRSWLLMVARRRLIDHWRRMTTNRVRLERLRRERAGGDPPEIDRHRIEEALDSLAERQRAAVVLRYMDDMSVSEVADALGETYRVTESLLARGRRAFRIAYEELS